MPNDITLDAAVRSAVEEFLAVGIPSPQVDALLLAAHVLGIGRGELAARLVSGDTLTREQLDRLAGYVARRVAREPLQHITGESGFRQLVLDIGPGAFVPRPETELLVQMVVDAVLASGQASPRVIDLGTGSGAIALAVASEVPHANVWAVEKSPEARAWAAHNNEKYGGIVTLLAGDLATTELLLGDEVGTMDVVVSNPPYIPDDAQPRDPEVRLYDPAVALFGGADGLDVIRQVASVAARIIAPGGLVAIEHGELQGPAVRKILADAGWRNAATHPDLTTRDRYTTAVWSA
ncbi:MAG: peptide chain release factor N(5)-glutamine methyltransferase [Actinobacteria bacterium]|nr:peptide chain release factor N(5)-glutamine methyltransferase [Actinomycetota bacterium]